VVDDDPRILELTGIILQRAGYRVERAASGAEALTLYQAATGDPFQLMLSDLVMPDISGTQLARQLRFRDPALKVLFVTGDVPARPQHNDPALGDFELLSKPFRPKDLVKAVQDLFEREAVLGTGSR
jgi:CheY-like chemotaxis protein